MNTLQSVQSDPSRTRYELYDRGLQRTLGRFANEAEALSYIVRCVQPQRVRHLTLGVELAGGQYAIVSDGYAIRRRLDAGQHSIGHKPE